EYVNQFLQDNLTRHRFGYFDDGRQIEVLDRSQYRRCRIRDGLVRSDLRVQPLELSSLPICSPTQVAVAGIAQVRCRNPLEPACRVETPCQLVRKTLVVDKAIRTCRTDSFLIELFSIELTIFDAGDLRADERGTVLKSFGVVLGPHFELPVMGCQR